MPNFVLVSRSSVSLAAGHAGIVQEAARDVSAERPKVELPELASLRPVQREVVTHAACVKRILSARRKAANETPVLSERPRGDVQLGLDPRLLLVIAIERR